MTIGHHLEVEICKEQNRRLGIYIQKDKNKRIRVVSKDDHIASLLVGDIITHENGKKCRNAKSAANCIIRSFPTVKLNVTRYEMDISLLDTFI